MESRIRILGIVLVAALLLVIVTGCDWLRKSPTATETPPADIPAEVLAARESALAYLGYAYAGEAPLEGITWAGRNTTPQGLVGVSYYEFSGNNWLMSIMVPVVAPDSVIYELELRNQDTGFRWMGKLDMSYAILESNLDVAAEALTVRDTILSHVRENYADQAPAENLVWVGARTTPEGSVGHETCRFTAGDWTMTVDYDLVQPDQMVYQIELHSSSTEFVWCGQLDAEGVILEHR